LRDLLRLQADYFERNRERMRYPRFRKQGLFIGSGESGMFWTVKSAKAIICATLHTPQRQVRGLLGISLIVGGLICPHLCRARHAIVTATG
jgi:hypothetical protein